MRSSAAPNRSLKPGNMCSQATPGGGWKGLQLQLPLQRLGERGRYAGRVNEPFRHRMRVRWSECDLQGVVFYAHYLAYFDIAMTELWREVVIPHGEMMDTGADMVVAEARIAYRASARFDDEIELVARS